MTKAFGNSVLFFILSGCFLCYTKIQGSTNLNDFPVFLTPPNPVSFTLNPTPFKL